MSFLLLRSWLTSFFFFNDTATTEIYTLSLHDALPISLLPTVCVDRPLSVFTSELNVTLESLLFLISSSSASSSSRIVRDSVLQIFTAASEASGSSSSAQKHPVQIGYDGSPASNSIQTPAPTAGRL